MGYIGQGPGQGFRRQYAFTATSGQTVFTGTDDNGVATSFVNSLTDVYVNGVNLIPITDFSVTNSTTLTLTSGVTLNDIVRINVYDTFSPADTMSTAEITAAIRGAGVPIGSVMFDPRGVGWEGYLALEGGTFDAGIYPDLFTFLGSSNILPDFRDRVLRHAGTLAGAASTTQEDAFQGHYHEGLGGALFKIQGGALTVGGGAGEGTAATTGDPATDGVNGTPRTASETRVKSYIGKYFIKAYNSFDAGDGTANLVAMEVATQNSIRTDIAQSFSGVEQALARTNIGLSDGLDPSLTLAWLNISALQGAQAGMPNGWVDPYASDAGLDANASANYSYDAVNDWFSPTGADDMTLVFNPMTAAAAPNIGRLLPQVIENVSVTANTDFKGWQSRISGAFTVAFGTDANALNDTAHGLANTTRVSLKASTTLPAGLTAGIFYYVVNATTNAFELSLTSGGLPIDMTGNGTGTLTWIAWTEATLADLNIPLGSVKTYSDPSTDLSAQPTGTSMTYALSTYNGKDIDFVGTGNLWE